MLRLGFLVALAACSAPAPLTKPAPGASACGAARARTRNTVTQLGSKAPAAAAQFDGCWDGWATALDAICEHRVETSDGAVSVLGRWVVMYTAPDGSSASHLRGGSTAVTDACVDRDHPGNIASTDLTTLAAIEPPQLFDFDGDGVPELLLADTHGTITLDADGATRHRAQRTSELLTYKRRVISRYAPALALRGVATNGIAGMRDVDGDGRPDLELTFHAAAPASVPRRVAHALPDGTFSETDAVARRALLAQCPPARELLVLRADNTIDNDSSFAALACAALRGERGRDITERLAKLCTGRSNECLNVERWAGEMYLYGVGTQ